MSPIEAVITALDSRGGNPVKNGSSWKALCPSHKDNNPSLSICEGDDGKVLLKCFAGCTTEAVLKKLGLAWRDVFRPYRPMKDANDAAVALGPEKFAEKTRELTEKAFSPEGQARMAPKLQAEPVTAEASVVWPDPLDLREFEDSLPRRPEELIEGVCYEQSKVYLSGPSKARKSFLMLMFALCVATGTSWLGRKVRKGRVLYINLELRPWVIQDRARRIQERLGLSLEQDALTLWNLRGLKISVEQLRSEFRRRRLHLERYTLIVVDPQYKVYGDREENKASDMADLLGELEAMAIHDAGAALLLAHHFAKGNSSAKESLDRSSGSGVAGRDCDLSITLTPHKEPDCFTFETTHRDFPPMPPVVLKWDYPVYIETGFNPAELKQLRSSGRPPAEDWTTERFAKTFYGTAPKSLGAVCLEAERLGLKQYKSKEFHRMARAGGLIHDWGNGPKGHLGFASVPKAEAGGGEKKPPHP